jgi:hypothetical protein
VKSLMKRKLLIAAIAAALLGGGAAALAATRSSSPHQAYLNDVARRLGVSPGALASAIQAARIDRIDAAVADGRLTRAQGEALKRRIHEGRGLFFGGRLLAGGRDGLIAPAASYLGISSAKLRTERRQGRSLAQIAAATPGKSVEGLKAALVAAAKSRLNAAVASGRITSKQASEVLSGLSTHLQALLERTSAHGARARPHQLY